MFSTPWSSVPGRFQRPRQTVGTSGHAVRVLGAVALTIVSVLAVCFGLLLVGMRWKLQPVLDAVRRFNKTVSNPRVLRGAGSTGSQTSLIRHAGRSSGRIYETPVDPIPTSTGFLIPLPYGSRSDWLRNVLTAGSATLVTRGECVDVEAPNIVATADVTDLMPRGKLRTLRLFGVTRCLRLQRVSPSE